MNMVVLHVAIVKIVHDFDTFCNFQSFLLSFFIIVALKLAIMYVTT